MLATSSRSRSNIHANSNASPTEDGAAPSLKGRPEWAITAFCQN